MWASRLLAKKPSSTQPPPTKKIGYQNPRRDMSLQKQPIIQQQDQVQQLPTISLTYKHPILKEQLGGSTNTQSFYYTICTSGDATNDRLFALDLSGLPGGQRCVLNVTGFRLFLVNYQISTVPTVFYLTSPEIIGMYDQTGNPSHIIASASVGGGLSTLMNTGGIVGANMAYCLTTKDAIWDISNVNNLTFGLLVGAAKDIVTYPLTSQITVQLMITKVSY